MPSKRNRRNKTHTVNRPRRAPSLRRSATGHPTRTAQRRMPSCHTSTGMQIPSQGFAPANPHVSTSQAAATDNCRQCHLFQTTKQHFAKSNFEPLRQDLKPGERLFLGAPPVIPHPTFMRENCQSCHTGAAARPEIRCTHPERANCTQCHVTKTHRSNQQVDASTDRAPPFPKRVGPM